MNKLKLTGVRNIPLLEDIEPKSGRDYCLTLIVQRISVENMDKEGEEDNDVVFKMKVVRPELFQEIGISKAIKIAKGFTKSQQLRSAIGNYLNSIGRDNYDDGEYEAEMDKVIAYYNSKVLKE